MSQIKKTVIVNCGTAESLIAESYLDVEIQNFDDFVTKKEPISFQNVQLIANSNVSWSITIKPFESKTTIASYLRFKVSIKEFSELLLESFNVGWYLYVKDDLPMLERTMETVHDNFNVNIPFFRKHVNSSGSLNLRLKMNIKSIGKQRLSRALTTTVPIYSTLKNLMNDASLSDFKFIVGKREFQVHKAILAASSPMMKRMFTINMTESKTSMCEVSGIEADIFAALLAFVYCGDLPINFSKVAAKLYEAARYYQIERLEAACALELQESLTEDNALEMYKWVHIFDELQELKSASWDLIRFNILKVFRPLEPMEPRKIDELLKIRQMESDFWKKLEEN